MSTYAELLLSDFWRAKRQSIINRDQFKCQNCNNENLLSNLRKGVIVGNIDEPFYKPQVIGSSQKIRIFTEPVPGFNLITTLLNPAIVNQDTTAIAYFKSDNEKPDRHNVIAIRKVIHSSQPVIKERDKTIRFEEQVLFPFSDEIIKAMSDINWSGYNWIFVAGLHVHHQYYIRDKNPWEYPDNALITLCWDCHEQLHKNGKINEFDEYGNFIQELTYCKRCHGAGWFPEYIHVEHGICFRCGGARYEELIDNPILVQQRFSKKLRTLMKR